MIGEPDLHGAASLYIVLERKAARLRVHRADQISGAVPVAVCNPHVPAHRREGQGRAGGRVPLVSAALAVRKDVGAAGRGAGGQVPGRVGRDSGPGVCPDGGAGAQRGKADVPQQDNGGVAREETGGRIARQVPELYRPVLHLRVRHRGPTGLRPGRRQQQAGDGKCC